MVISIIKNWKNILIVALIIVLAFFIWRVEDMKADYANEKIKLYEDMIKDQKAHQKRLEDISRDTSDISKKINNLKLTKDKCQDEEYYITANDIVKRFNRL